MIVRRRVRIEILQIVRTDQGRILLALSSCKHRPFNLRAGVSVCLFGLDIAIETQWVACVDNGQPTRDALIMSFLQDMSFLQEQGNSARGGSCRNDPCWLKAQTQPNVISAEFFSSSLRRSARASQLWDLCRGRREGAWSGCEKVGYPDQTEGKK